MNALTPRAANGAVAIFPHLPMPPLPEPVQSYLSALEDFAEAKRRFYAATPEEREGMYLTAPKVPALAGDAAKEAARLADAMTASLAPISLAALRAWLAPVNAACRNPQDRQDFEARLQGIHALCEDLPHGAFTSDARRSLPEFFPSAHDVRDAVKGNASRLRAAHSALVKASTPPPEPPPTPEPVYGAQNAEDIALAKAKAAEAKAYLRAAEEPPEMRKVKPAYLSPGQLLSQYRKLAAEGNAAAKVRLAALEAQIAKEAATHA